MKLDFNAVFFMPKSYPMYQDSISHQTALRRCCKIYLLYLPVICICRTGILILSRPCHRRILCERLCFFVRCWCCWCFLGSFQLFYMLNTRTLVVGVKNPLLVRQSRRKLIGVFDSLLALIFLGVIANARRIVFMAAHHHQIAL